MAILGVNLTSQVWSLGCFLSSPFHTSKLGVPGFWLGLARKCLGIPDTEERPKDRTCGWLGLLWRGFRYGPHTQIGAFEDTIVVFAMSCYRAQIFGVGFWQNGFFADFYFWAAGFCRGFCRRIFSPQKVPRKILQENPRQNPPNFIQQKSPTIFCRGARPKISQILKSVQNFRIPKRGRSKRGEMQKGVNECKCVAHASAQKSAKERMRSKNYKQPPKGSY